MTGETKLAPCPFCGATDDRLIQSFTRATDECAFWSVECLDCGVAVADDESQEAADCAWNRRTPDPKLDRATEALEKARWYAAFYNAAKHRGSPQHKSDAENTADLTAIDATLAAIKGDDNGA
jgi:Lar family restriction alleviation protein